MLSQIKKTLLITLILSLTSVSFAANKDSEKNLQRLKDMSALAGKPLVSAREIKKAPQIDGKISLKEWQECSAFTGFRGFFSKKLAAEDMTMFCGYDKDKFYFLALIPMRQNEVIKEQVRERDTRVYKDSSIELYIKPSRDSRLRQLVINSNCNIYDSLDGDSKWNGDWKFSSGREIPQEFKDLCLIEKGWFLEGALPFSELGTSVAKDNEWLFNIAKNGDEILTYAPVVKAFKEPANFAKMVFVSNSAPAAAIYSLGKPNDGILEPSGRFFNYHGSLQRGKVDIWAIKKDTTIQEKTGYDEVVGKLEDLQKEFDLQEKVSTFKFYKYLDGEGLDILNTAFVGIDSQFKEHKLFDITVPFQVKQPLGLKVENYPSKKTVICDISLKSFRKLSDKFTSTLIVKDNSGKAVVSKALDSSLDFIKERIDYSKLKPGKHLVELAATLPKGGKTFKTSKEVNFSELAPWVNNTIGISREILPPFTPMTQGPQSVSMWDRTYEWSDKSIFPAKIISGKSNLLSAPIQLVVEKGGVQHRIPMQKYRMKSFAPDRAVILVAGKKEGIHLSAELWVEYDGLIWFNVRFFREKADLIDRVFLEIVMPEDSATHYHAAPNRAINGRVKDKKETYPYQVYFWLGTEERGIGFISESQESWVLPKKHEVFSLTPEKGNVVWQVDLIAKSTRSRKRTFEFGLQATPVKPLPADYHSSFTSNWSDSGKSLFQRHKKRNDFTTVWLNSRKFMKYICDPAGVDYEMLKEGVDNSHASGVPAIPYFAPISFSEDIREEHIDFHHEWMNKPARKWKSGSVQTRACMNSSYLNWMLWNFQKTIQNAGADGLYFDGGVPIGCINSEHGCGWIDSKGTSRLSFPVLKVREFMKRSATMVYQEVQKRKKAGVKYPGDVNYVIWAHLSGAVMMPVHSFVTSFFCGEWFKGPIKSGKSYADLLTVDTFLPRYISTPWGVPNFFLPISVDNTTGESKQSEAIMAYLLPLGNPLYARYLNGQIVDKVLKAKEEFDTRNSEYYPPWKKCRALNVKKNSKDLIAGVWVNKAGDILAALGNTTKTEQKATLEFTGNYQPRAEWPSDFKGVVQSNAGYTVVVKNNSFVLLRFSKVK
ncbi:MAG: glycoside hydrolase domain-containing protein [Planctomycetota bacterium]|jgi:hypothetical protein